MVIVSVQLENEHANGSPEAVARKFRLPHIDIVFKIFFSDDIFYSSRSQIGTLFSRALF